MLNTIPEPGDTVVFVGGAKDSFLLPTKILLSTGIIKPGDIYTVDFAWKDMVDKDIFLCLKEDPDSRILNGKYFAISTTSSGE